MKKLLIGVLCFMALTSLVQASGDADAGKNKVATCVACHGQDGNSASPAFPKLAGQNEKYLVKQMKDIQCGGLPADEQKRRKCMPRSVPTMAGQLDNMSAQDLEDIAAFYASQPVTSGQAKESLVALGEEIYRAGIREKNVAACTACHSPKGKGNAPAGFPALGGQHADYIAAQLKAFRDAADYGEDKGRANDGDTKVMRDIAYRLSDQEIEAVSSYISGLY